MKVNERDLLAGAFFVLFGIFYGGYAITYLPVGSATRMGPGYFSVAIAIIMILLGSAIAFHAFFTAREAIGKIAVRGTALICLGVVLFGVTIEGLGFIPALTASMLVACFATRRMTMGFAAALTAAITLFCYLVFSVALGLPLVLFGPWLVD